MPAPIYGAAAGADVALVAATVKSVLGIKAHANSGLLLKMVSIAFDGSGSSAPTNEPILVEVCYSTWATNSPGTNSTSETPAQLSGRVMTVGATAASNWSAEPTALTVLDEYLLHPQSGIKEYLPLGDEFDSTLAEGFVLRVTAPNAVNCRPGMRFSRC